ncbi:hypothetical protein SRRS_09950 [Sporomusa rhizae]|uniref:DUF421 domain-containing protein n=1 Tax=Sporomusa rhizae TaxID=357999 RepID=UPI00352A5588
MSEAIEYSLRTALSFFLLLLLTRTFGRKQLAEITLFDFISTITLGTLAVSSLITPILNLVTGLITLAVWAGLVMVSNFLSLKSLPARKFLEGEPVMVIHNGQVLENNLAKTYYTVNDLLAQLRIKNIFDPSEIQIGILEANGELSILKKSDLQASVPAAMNYTGKELIIDGQIIDTALRRAGLTRQWLQNELKNRSIPTVAEVSLAIITPSGKVYIDLKDDEFEK